MNSVKNIGRDPKNDIVINDANISEFHAQLKIGDSNQVHIIDLVSDKGIFVNGVRIQLPHLLKTTDTILFGEYSFDWKAAADVKPIQARNCGTKYY